MKILVIRNTVNGPTRGDTLDLPEDEAKRLICEGVAEPAPEKAFPAPEQPQPEEKPEPVHKEKAKHKAKH